MELGVYTFADMEISPGNKNGIIANRRIQQLMEEIKLADEVGLDVFAVGEHHRPDYAVSAPSIILGAAAAVTKNIRLSSAVTVLSSEDPVRVFQQYATIDLISSGRAEIMVGRGSFIESYPLFGYDLKDYDELFSEKLDLLLKLNLSERITWKGKHRAALNNLGIYPRPMQQKLPVWIAVGGTPESAQRAGRLQLPMALAIIGGTPSRFVPFTKIYKDAALSAGVKAETIQLGINSLGYIGKTYDKACDEFYPYYSVMMNRLGKERGWDPISRDHYDMMTSYQGALVVGSPTEVAEKILYEYELFGNTRFLLQTSIGTLPHHLAMKSIELFGTKVAPEVKKRIRWSKRKSEEKFPE
ncbi:MAG: LLM class flavin-dependent oxidoreductase [Cytophagaceae bacterium]